MTESLTIERNPDCWILTLNRPEKRNALSAELVEALIAEVEDAHAQAVSLLVFRGTGKNLSAGFDLAGYQDQSDGDLVLRMIRIEHLLQLIARSPSLTLAWGHGRNFGAGVDLFGACKLRYCTSDSSFRMPGLKFGLVLGSRRFRTLVGVANALSILGSARTFDAQEALRIGFVDQIVAETEWPDLLAKTTEIAVALDPVARSSLYQALDVNEHDVDLAALTRSVSRPGLKERISDYLQA